MRAPGKRKKQFKVLFYSSMIILVIIFLFPILWTGLTSIKTRVDALSMPPVWIFGPTLKSYLQVFARGGFNTAYINSIIVGIGTTVLTVIAGSLAGYALTRFRFFGSHQMPFLILLTRMFPPLSLAFPLFFMFKEFGLLDTHIAVIISNCSLSLPFVVWLMWGYFQTLPTELDESALIDGCNRFQVLYKVVLPMSLPGLVAVSLFTFVGSWNAFFFPLILTRIHAKTLPVQIAGFVTSQEVLWGQVNAAAMVCLVPAVVFNLLAQKGIVKGLTMGSIK